MSLENAHTLKHEQHNEATVQEAKRQCVRMAVVDLVTWARRNVLTELLPLVVLLVLAAVLRFPALGDKSLWFDEVRSYYDSRDAFVLLERPHLLAFKLMNLALRLGHDWDFLLRVPSALAGVLSVVFLYLAARVAFDRATAILAAFLLALSSYNIWYSQEARFYGLMMLLAACSLYFVILLFEKKSLWTIAAIAALGYASYVVHPTTLVFFSAEITFIIPWLMINPVARSKIVRPLRRAFERRQIILLLAVAIMLLILLIALYRFAGRRIFGVLLGVLEGQIVLGDTVAPEVDLSWRFLYRHIRVFATMGLRSDWLATAAAFCGGFCFIAGVAIMLFKKRSLAVFLLYVPILTLLALLTFPTHQTYAVKYVSFLLPLYVLSIAYCVARLPFLLFKDNLTSKPVRQFVPWVVLVVLSAPLVVANAMSLITYYAGERMNYKGAVREFLRQTQTEVANDPPAGERQSADSGSTVGARPRAVIAAYGLSHYVVEYYCKYFGLPPETVVALPLLSGEGSGAVNALRRLCTEHSAVYFVTGWSLDQPARLLQWVDGHFETVKSFPALPGVYCATVHLYRCTYGGRYIAYPHSYRAFFARNGEVRSLGRNAADDVGHTDRGFVMRPGGWRQTFFFDAASNYVLSLTGSSLSEHGGEIAVLMDKHELGLMQLAGGVQNQKQSFTMSVSSGRHEIEFLPRGTGVSQPLALRIDEILIAPDYSREVQFQAEDFTFTQPTYRNSTGNFRDRDAFVMPLNSYVGYEIDFPVDGTYEIGLEANNDKPGPVTIEIVADKMPVGFLSFNRGDNTWEKQYLPLEVRAGSHTLMFSFVSYRLDKTETGEDKETVGALDSFTIKRVSPGAPRVRDDRFPFKQYLFHLQQADYYPFEDPARPGYVKSSWYFARGQVPVLLDPTERKGSAKSLRLEVPFDAETIVLAANIGKVPERAIIYFSLNIKTKDLDNHSASAVVQYFDKDRKALAIQWATQQGFTGTTDWQRQVYVRSTPKNADHVMLTLAVYENSKKTNTKTGYVWFDDVRIEQLPE